MDNKYRAVMILALIGAGTVVFLVLKGVQYLLS